MLKITTHSDGSQTTLELEGRLAGPWVEELKACWQRAAGGGRIKVILKQVSYVDGAGKTALAEMHRQGTELAAEGCMIKAIIEEIEAGEAK